MKITRRIAAIAAAFVLACAPVVQAEEVDPALTQTVEDSEITAAEGETVEVLAGHVDMGPRLVDGKWTLMVRDDTGDTPVWRHIDDVVFRVDEKAQMTVPSEGYAFVGSQNAWVIPQTEISGVPWLGWNTQAPAVVENVNGGVNLTYGGHQGEGKMSLFLQAGNFGQPQVLFDSALGTAQSVYVDLNTHTHANWAFSAEGVHLVKVSASATLNDGRQVTDSQVLRFAVGNASSQEAAGAEWTLTNDPGKAAATAAEEPSARSDSSTVTYILIGAGAVLLAAIAFAVIAHGRNRRMRREAEADSGE